MNRRSILRLLGFAPVAAPLVAAAAARVVTEAAPLARTHGMSVTVDGQTAHLTTFAGDTIRGGQAQLSRAIERLSTVAQDDIRSIDALWGRAAASEETITATAQAMCNLGRIEISHPNLTCGPVTITA